MIRGVLLLLLLFPLVALAQENAPFTSKNGKFSVRFPGMPKESEQKTKSSLGELKVYTATFATNDGSAYLVSAAEFPAGTATAETRGTLFDGARDSLKGTDGKILSDKDVEVGPDKLPGRDLELQMKSDQARFRMVIRGDRIYHIAVIGKAAFVSGKDATQFIESFEITK